MQTRLANIIRIVARHYSIPPAEILAQTRRRAIVEPRHVAIYLATTHTKLSLPAIGKQIGDRDHSTIMYARDRIAARMKVDLPFAMRMAELTLRVEAANQGLGPISLEKLEQAVAA
jgi:chromosomal replication initiator protein